MTKLNKALLGLLGLQVVVLVVLKLVSSSGPQMVKPKPIFDKLTSDAIAAIRISEDDKLVELAKQGDKWVLANGGGYPVTESKVKELLGKLPGLEAARPIASSRQHHRALQVAKDDHQREVTLTLKDGKKIHFYLGSSPGIKKCHLRFVGKDDVYLVSGISAWDLGTSAGGWIDTQYLKLDKDKVVALSVTNEHGQIQLTKGSDGKWQLADAPAGAKLKDSAITSLVGSASAVHMKQPVGTKVEASFGLDTPKALVAVVTEQQPEDDKTAAKPDDPKPDTESAAPAPQALRKTHLLKIGGKIDEAYYAQHDGSKFVVQIAKWNADTFLDKKLSDLLAKEGEEDKGNKPPPMPPGGGLPMGVPGMPPSAMR